ncbi:transcription elongation factor SPT5 [Parasteatoda tepidariorum]|uniref:transcription elongation factor SPT5 n=1 Tax=Parasteatoda tepidariorum TaxID=114398 RepID=UPI001C71FF15|nr:transcription elongation factor SPT5 [Parasteatoda tepidariorum]XP_042899208.1 transcription elongation factor SPT5 [Parasteatoda tepidariorum]
MSDSEASNYSGNESEAEEQESEGEQDDAKSAQGSDAESDAGSQVNEDEAEEVTEAEAAAEEEEQEEEPEGEDLDEEDEEDEEDEDDEDDDDRDRKKRKKKKSRYGDFILDEAEVDDEVEEDEEWEEGAEDIIDRTRPTEEGTSRDIDSHRRLQMMWTSQKEDEIEEYYKKKYAESSAAEKGYGDGGDHELPDEIAQQTLLPSVKDPNLWMVKCRLGEEKQTVLLLMRKFIAYQYTEEPLQIKSVVAPEGVKGYIYIEAYKQTHVKQAINGVGSLRMGQYQQMMVPIKEMTDVLRVTKEQTQLKPKQWVRLKRGLYKDDLAQVDFVNVAQNFVHLKLIPRIDYTKKRGALRTSEPEKRKKGRKPPPKLFDVDAIRALGGEVSTDGDYLIFEGNRFSRKGFLFKSFAKSALIIDGVKPTLSELEKFAEKNDAKGMEIELSETGQDDGSHSFSPGDNVEVCEGELIHLQGRVITVDGNKVTMLPTHEDLKDPLEFPAHELRKYFKMGDHVKVIAGTYEGDTGLIVRVEEKIVLLFSDLTMHELKVRPQDLQLCTDMATGVDSLGQFQWGDLVLLDAQTVGVIVRLEKENFHILNMHGNVVKVKHQSITKRKDTRKAVSLDSEQNQIQARDVVKVIDGPHSGRQGEIKHLYRSFAFLHSRMMTENGGIFVCKTRHLALAGAGSGGGRPVSEISMRSPFHAASPRINSPMHPSAGGRTPGSGFTGGASPGPGGGMGRGRGGRRDNELIGQTIKITHGPYKGHIGIVKDATEATARVELHSKCQTISVDRTRLAVVGGPSKGSVSSYSRTPIYGSQTPMYGAGSRTPMYGSQTPQYESGSRTPHYGSQTPLHEGNRTPSHGGAWDPSNANTPARGSSDFDEYPFEEPSPSPANYAATPAYQQDQGPFTPQTPGSTYADHNYSPYQTPSPGGYPAGTPSPSTYAATPSPSGYAGTPSPGGYGYSPMTPGAPPTPGGMDPTSVEWQTTDLEVVIRDTHSDDGLSGQTGIIRGISGGMCSVFLPKEDRVVNIMGEHLEPVTPLRGDKVKVIYGDDRELCGTLLTIDCADGVVKLGPKEFKMINMRFLCKMI